MYIDCEEESNVLLYCSFVMFRSPLLKLRPSPTMPTTDSSLSSALSNLGLLCLSSLSNPFINNFLIKVLV